MDWDDVLVFGEVFAELDFVLELLALFRGEGFLDGDDFDGYEVLGVLVDAVVEL